MLYRISSSGFLDPAALQRFGNIHGAMQLPVFGVYSTKTLAIQPHLGQ
jgi:hypothetical protein